MVGVAEHIVLLRGINVGGRNRLAMPELRALLSDAGFDRVRTYLQSGNVVLSSAASPDEVARECERQISTHLGLAIEVIVRTRDELAEILRRNPLEGVAVKPKRHQVTFLAAELEPAAVEKITAAAAGGEEVVALGREVYAWHPDGVGRSRLAALLSGKQLGVAATARNWDTVTSLLALADE